MIPEASLDHTVVDEVNDQTMTLKGLKKLLAEKGIIS